MPEGCERFSVGLAETSHWGQKSLSSREFVSPRVIGKKRM